MATLQELKDAMAGLSVDIAAEKVEVQGKLADLGKQIADLKDELTKGVLVTQTDLDELAASVAAIDAGVKDISEPAPVGPPAQP